MSATLLSDIETAKVISFDLFDTLFVRPLLDPEDVFDIIGEKFAISHFRQLRRDAQTQAFRRMHEERRNEITLQQIYDQISIPGVDASDLYAEEYGLELALTRPNPKLIHIFDELVTRKQVVITSDMYLPLSFFTDLFNRYGLPGIPMFISSDRNATKRDRGELFQIMAEALNVSGDDVLHIGDNPVSDIQQAKAKGFRTFHYQNARVPAPVSLVSPSASLASALVRVQEADVPPKSFYELGFLYGGPGAIAFLHWIQKQAAKDELDLLLFVSRDGYVLEHLAAKGYAGQLPRSAYFKGSRVSFATAATNEKNFNSQLDFFVAGADDLAPVEVLERIGVPAPSERLMKDLDLGRNVQVNAKTLSRLRAFLFAYRWEILKICRRNRQGLFQYLLDLGVTPGMRIGMVDVGWSGTTQKAFEHSLMGLVDVKVFGYYLCLKNDPCVSELRKSMQMKALISTDTFPEETVARIHENRVAVEILFSAPHDTVIGYERLANGTVRIVEDPGRSRPSHDLAKVCQEVTQGMEDFSELFRHVCQAARYRPKPLGTVSPLVAFVSKLNKGTEHLFSSVLNFDAWASTRNRSMALADYIAAQAGG